MNIKRYHDYTEDELLALSEQEGMIDRLIDLECAYKGLPLLPEDPGPEPTTASILPDSKVYEIGGITFADAEDAAALLTFLEGRQLVQLDWRGHGGKYVIKPMPEDDYRYPKIELKSAFTSEHYEKFRDKINNIEGEKSAWERKRKDYDSAVELRKEVADEIWEIVSQRRTDLADIAGIVAEYKRYYDLANSDPNVALRFLLDARNKHKEDFRVTEDNVAVYINTHGVEVPIPEIPGFKEFCGAPDEKEN